MLKGLLLLIVAPLDNMGCCALLDAQLYLVTIVWHSYYHVSIHFKISLRGIKLKCY